MDWLKKYPKTTFLNTGFPNKLMLFEQIQDHPYLRPYIPLFTLLKKPSDLISMIKRNGYCHLQPLAQQLSASTYFIYVKDPTTITVQFHQDQTITFSRLSDVERWCQKFIGRYFIQCFDITYQKDISSGEIRIFFIKNAKHEWHNIGNQMKLVAENRFLNNTQNKNHMLGFEHYLHSLQPHIKQLLLDDIATIHSSLPEHLDRTFSPFIEFAVDLLHTSEGKLFITNMRSKPARSAFLKAFPEKENLVIRLILEHAQSMIAHSKEVPHDRKALHYRSTNHK
ncbi:YheC/YheD family protein [Bacillus pumilus]|nr:YheC/YheD family protein [Bacillus pumilus]